MGVPERFLRLKDVMQATGLRHSAIYEQMALGRFPRQVRITGRWGVAWLESEISAWQQERIAERNKRSKNFK